MKEREREIQSFNSNKLTQQLFTFLWVAQEKSYDYVGMYWYLVWESLHVPNTPKYFNPKHRSSLQSPEISTPHYH